METSLKQSTKETSGQKKPDCICSRCGGLMVVTFCIAPDQGSWVYQIPVMKCLQCGDLVDATILNHRRLSRLVHSTN